MFKYILILVLVWLLLRSFSRPRRYNQASSKRETSRSKPEGSTTVTRVGEPKKKIVDSSEADTAHYEEVE
jgi:flagellar biosynthesis/type III secretory pathway M-ring protein FliF/YscJ